MSSLQIEWSRHENKLFEIVMVEVDPNSPNRFEKIASKVPGKTAEQIEIHYQMLVDDIEMIESDGFPIPEYQNINDQELTDEDSNIQASKKRITSNKELVGPTSTKGIPWTEEEHRMFLMGLNNCGKGDWRNISRNYVKSRTPTQVASHAQKYFLRISNSGTIRERHRSSIHDIRNIGAGAADDHPFIKMSSTMMNKPILSANTNNFIPIAPAPYPAAAAVFTSSSSSSFSSFSSNSSTTTTTTTTSPASTTTTAAPLILMNSSFNIGSSSRINIRNQLQIDQSSNSNYYNSIGTGTGTGGVDDHSDPSVAAEAAASASNILMDVDNSSMNHPYNYDDHPIYSPAYDPLYPAYI